MNTFSPKPQVLKELGRLHEALRISHDHNAVQGWVFTVEVFNDETIYELRNASGSILYSMTEAMADDDSVWDAVAEILDLPTSVVLAYLGEQYMYHLDYHKLTDYELRKLKSLNPRLQIYYGNRPAS